MKLSQIVSQLHIIVPQLTDLFSDVLPIVSITQSGTTVTVVTSVASGLSNGNIVNIAKARVPNPITSLTATTDDIGDIAVATTSLGHDLTELYPDDEDTNVIVSGASISDYNGTFPLLSVLNRNNFTYRLPTTPAGSATGAVLQECIFGAFNGIAEITVINNTTFTFQQAELFADPILTDAQLSVRTRIARIGKDGGGSGNISNAINAYTKKGINELYAFVGFGGRIVSKDRNTDSDATQFATRGVDSRQRVLQTYNIYVFVPRTSNFSGGSATDLMSDLLPILTKSIKGFRPDTTTFAIEPLGEMVYLGDDTLLDDGTIYIHEFDFEISFDIVPQDAFLSPDNRAFRDTNLIINDRIQDSDDVLFDDNINLDDEPI